MNGEAECPPSRRQNAINNKSSGVFPAHGSRGDNRPHGAPLKGWRRGKGRCPSTKRRAAIT